MIDLSKPPISEKYPDFQFPDYDIIGLKPGLRVIFLEDKLQPFVTVKAVFHDGAWADTIPGLANFTTGMLTNGTISLSQREISNKIDFYGASVNSAAYWDESLLSMTCMGGQLRELAPMFVDILLNPAFSEDETVRHKKKNIASVSQMMSDPNYITQVAFNSKFYYGQPYAHPRIGTMDDIGKINPGTCREFYNSLFSKGITLIAAGNFDRQFVNEEIISKIEAREFSLVTPESHERGFSGKNYTFVSKKGASQVTLRVGFPAAPRSHVDYPALQMLNVVFGGYFLSRLNSVLREEKGLTYGINSYIDTRRHSSNFVIGTGINAENSGEAISEILAEMEKIAESGIKEEELGRARHYIMGSFLRGTETMKQRASLIQNVETFGLGKNYYNEFFESISRLTISDIDRVREKYFRPRDILVTAGGDAETIKKSTDLKGEFEEIKL